MKEQQLIEFARLVTGIRLFNKDCKRGGEGIVDRELCIWYKHREFDAENGEKKLFQFSVPLILTQGVKASQDRVINYKNQVDKRIENLVKVLMQVYDEKKTDTEEIDVALSSGKLEELKSLLIYARQIEFCLKWVPD